MPNLSQALGAGRVGAKKTPSVVERLIAFCRHYTAPPSGRITTRSDRLAHERRRQHGDGL
jgi:hypothetical protein